MISLQDACTIVQEGTGITPLGEASTAHSGITMLCGIASSRFL